MRETHLACHILCGFGIHKQSHDQAVKTQHFGENEDKDHADEKTRLLGRSPDAGVTDDADCEPLRKFTSVVCLNVDE